MLLLIILGHVRDAWYFIHVFWIKKVNINQLATEFEVWEFLYQETYKNEDLNGHVPIRWDHKWIIFFLEEKYIQGCLKKFFL